MDDKMPTQETAPPGAIDGATPAAAPMTPVKGLVVLVAVMAVIMAFIGLTGAVGVSAWVSFLFLTYWGCCEQMKLEKLPPCIVGALTGLVAAYLLQALPATMGTAGLVLALLAIMALIYCLIMGWLRIAANTASMLFLTVGTIPLILGAPGFARLFPALGLGIAYFAAVAWIIQWFAQRSARKQES